jgi:hypothetical protein
MKIQSKMRVRLGSRIHKYESVPEILIKVGLCLPDGCDIRDMEWFPVQVEPPAPLNFRKILLSIEAERPAQRTPEQAAAETERVLKLPPAEFRRWVAEQQERNDAALTNLMPWGGLA